MYTWTVHLQRLGIQILQYFNTSKQESSKLIPNGKLKNISNAQLKSSSIANTSQQESKTSKTHVCKNVRMFGVHFTARKQDIKNTCLQECSHVRRLQEPVQELLEHNLGVAFARCARNIFPRKLLR